MTYIIDNCFILLLPVFIWNAIFFKSLPLFYQEEYFEKDIPPFVKWSENILRIIVFIMPLIMKISIKNTVNKVGLILYILGIIVYFSSWLMQIYCPKTKWSRSLAGFMAPAYTTIIWFVGICLIGSVTFIKIPYFAFIYFTFCLLFVTVHSMHTFIVYTKNRNIIKNDYAKK